MPDPLLRTKLFFPPLRPNLVPRPRLIQRLNQGLELGHKLALISAPAGFGKSTLLCAWVAEHQERTAWLTLDQHDNDPARFFSYLVSALQTVFPEVGQRALSLLQTPQLPRLENLLALLSNDLAEWSDAALLILDDFHLITSRQIHQALSFWIDHLPPSLQLVIAGRIDPLLPLPRLRANAAMTEIRQADLQFTPSETAEFLSKGMELELEAQDITALATRTEGWIASLQLAALALRREADPNRFIASFSGSHTYIMDYLLQEVWQQQPQAVQTFLMKTVVLEQLSGALCDALTGNSDGEAMLQRLYRDNMFLIPLDNERRWYRYHHLFADVLQRQSESTHADERAQLHLKAAQWYEAHHLLPQAVHHARASQDMNAYARTVGLAADEEQRQGKSGQIGAWLDAVPEAMIRADHRLSLARAWSLYMMGEADAASRYVAAAERSIDPATPVHDRVNLLSLKAFIAYALEDFQRCIQWSKEAHQLLGDSNLRDRGVILLNLGQAHWASGELDAAVATVRRSISASQQAGDPFVATSAIGVLLKFLRLQGRFHEALHLGNNVIQQYVDRRGDPLPLVGFIFIYTAKIEYERNELEAAYSRVKTGISLCQEMDDLLTLMAGQMLRAQIAQATGREAEARDTLRGLRPMADRPRVGKLLQALEADIALKQGDRALAGAWAAATEPLLVDTPIHVYESVYLTYARWLLSEKRPAEAGSLLNTVAQSAREQGRAGSLVPIHILQAICLEAQGDHAAARALLGQAVAQATPEGHLRPFHDALPRIRGLLETMRQTAPEFIDLALATPADPPTPSVASLSEPLHERERAILRLMAAGLSNPDIARELFLTVNTVKWYAKSLFQKLGVHSRIAAVARAQELDIL